MKITEIKQKIQDLINQTVSKNEEQKNRLNYLFRKLDELKEIETMERLKEYAGGKYLKAYLLYKSIIRANYQPEHLELVNFKNVDKYLEAIDKDIELVRKDIEKEPVKPSEPTNEQLLILLGERIGTKEIKCNWSGGEIFHTELYLTDDEGNKTMSVDLGDGKIEPDPVKELLEKHGWNDKKE